MGFLSRFGFNKPRDAPEKLPDIQNNVRDYGSAFFKNGAQPAGVLEHPGVLKDPQKIRDNWTRTYGGARNAHRIAVLEEGMRPDRALSIAA